MNADPDPGNKIIKLISNPLLKSRKKIIFKSVPKPYRIATFLGSDLKNIISYEKTPKTFVGNTLRFPSFYIPGSGSTNPNECVSYQIRIHITVDYTYGLKLYS